MNRGWRFFLLCAFCLPLLSVEALPPRSLVSRMIDAREGFRPPAKEMRCVADAGADASKWPFDVARVEGMLEKALLRMPDGSWALRRQGEGASTDSRERSAAALSYVNRVISDWAVMKLDARFERCDAETVRSLSGYREDMDPLFRFKFAVLTKKGLFGGGQSSASGWVTGWKVGERVYLLLTSELSSPGSPRDYQFVMWDGRKDWPIAGFDTFPDAPRALAAMRVTESAAAANNLAALLHARDANRRVYMPEYIEPLLRRAATQGCEDAFYNLGVLMEERGDLEEAKAFFSRER